MKKLAILGAIAMAVACVGSAFGTTWYVSPSGDGTDPSAGFATGYATIKAAFANSALADNDTILLDKCTFDLSYENRANEINGEVTITKSITVSGAGTRDETVLNGGREYSGRYWADQTILRHSPRFTFAANNVTFQNMTFEKMGSDGSAAILGNNNVTGSVVSNMTFRNTGAGYETWYKNAFTAHVNLRGGGAHVSCCVFTNNVFPCAVLEMSGTSGDMNLENCYFANNTCDGSKNDNGVVHSGFGVYEGKGLCRNNTIVNNKSKSGALKYSNWGKNRVVNNIIYGNTDLDGNEGKNFFGDGSSYSKLWTCNCLGAGTWVPDTSRGNIYEDPGLADDNMHLDSVLSPCYQAGSATYATAYDIDGNARDAEKPCIGCSEYVSKGFTCTIKATAEKVSLPETVTLSVEIAGTPSGALTYAWDVGGVSYNTETVVLSKKGKYSVSIVVTDASGNMAVATYPKSILIYGEGESNFTWYVSPNGSGKNPTAGFETGYPTIKAALKDDALSDGDTILLDTCRFDLGSDNWRGDISTSDDAITKRITISGAGTKEETILDGGREWDRRNSGQDKFYPQLCVKANGVVIRNMTLERMGSNGNPAIEVNNNYTDCVISNVIVRNSGWGYTQRNGGSGYVTTGNQNTKVTSSVFTNNCTSCAIVYMSGGAKARLENCYIANNTCTGWNGGTNANGVVYAGFGEYEGKGWCRNNTIINNKSVMGALCHDNYGNCRIVNNIIYGNTDLDGNGPKDVYQKSSYTYLWTHNCIGEGNTVYTGAGNIFSLPGFAADNFHLKAGSHCIGAASPTYATSHDIDGVERNAEKPCIGCSEYVDTSVFTCAIAAPSALYVVQPATMTFTASVDGEAVEPVKYEWDVDGDGTYDRCTNEVVLSAVGEYVISVKATDAKGNEATSALEGKRYIYPADKTFYVTCKPNPAAKPPYAGWASAANSLNDVCEHASKFDSSRIVLDDGVHTVSTTVVLTNGMVVASLNGRDKTVITTLDKDRSMFNLNDPNAVLEGVTLTGRAGNVPNCEGSAVLLSSGTLRDSMITNWNSFGSGMISTRGCTAARPSAIERCIFADCTGTGTNAVPGVYLVSNSKVTLENCLFCNIVTKWPGTWSWNLGSALNCASGEAVIRNCTFATNDCVSCYPLHITTEPKVFENNILFGNTTNETFAANDVVLKDAYNKDRGVVSTVAYTCVTAGERDYSKNVGVIMANPGFVDAANGDYHLLRNASFTSPCIGKGNNGAYAADAIDLDGNKRLVGRRVDMGCYENQTEYGTQMILR